MNNNKHDYEPTGLYVHIPFCESKCKYCGFYSEPIHNYDPDRLIYAIITELNNKTVHKSHFQTVYIGGGSPSCLPEWQLTRLINEITSKCSKPDEFTVEINPKQGNDDLLGLLRTTGVNRLSIGAQSFNDDELAFLGRRHSSADIKQAVEAAKKAGFSNIGLDLIFAIPDSTPQSWEISLQSAIDLDIQHISTYALTYEEDTPLQYAVSKGKVKPIDEETDRAMYETAIEKLEDAGFKQYEISNFARLGFECKHNLNYWANKPYIGTGPAAGSFWQGRRTINISDITKYIDAIEHGLDATEENEISNPVQVACETAVLNLRRRTGIDFAEFKKQTGFDAKELFTKPIAEYKKLGLIEETNGQLFLTQKALPIADSVLCDFSDV
jgi:oxygen-independent coproporphyrinogen III oxidase